MKKKKWMGVALLATASLFAQEEAALEQSQEEVVLEQSQEDVVEAKAPRPMNQGYAMGCKDMPAIYNAPAAINVDGAWDFYVAGSFTYWQASQENMELGIANATTTGYAINGNVVQMDFDYQPGFKIGLGMNCEKDGWDSFAEYTWYRGKDDTYSNQDFLGVGSTFLPLQGHPQLTNTGSPTYSSGNETWKLNMDLLNWDLARTSYFGTHFSVRPFFGARAAWIRQRFTGVYHSITSSARTVSMSNQSNSWGVGARAGAYTNWMLGKGFRLYGNGAGDILYTRYSSVRFSEVAYLSGAAASTIAVKQKQVGTLRPHLELEFGFGWGTYFDEDNWHVDFLLGYTFQVFFNQNMSRHYTGTAAPVNGYSQSPNGDLFVQGLTTSLRFDF